MYSATFIFAKKQYDEEFHRLDQAIADAAKEIPGYLGEETWENPSTGLISNVYTGTALRHCTRLSLTRSIWKPRPNTKTGSTDTRW